MKRCLFLLLAVGMFGCDNKQTASVAPPEEKKPPSRRPVPVMKPISKSKPAGEKPAQPEAEAPYLFGDVVFALQEDAKAKQYRGNTGVDPRIFKPDARHERLRNILIERYEQDISLANVLKLRDELCKVNELTPEQVNALPLNDVTDVFDKKE